MELAKIDHNKLTSVAEKRFKSPAIKRIDPVEMKLKVTELISLVYFKCRFKIEQTDLMLMSSSFYDELILLYPWITIHEIEHCFSQGYRDVYGEYMGLSIKTFLGWISSFEKTERQEMLRKAKENLPKVPSLPEISETEKKNIILSGLKRCFNDFLVIGTVSPGSFYLYDFLDEQSLLPKDKKTKEAVLKIANRNILSQSKSALTQEERRELSIYNSVGKPSNKVVIECKRLSLNSFFSNFTTEEQLLSKIKN